VAGRFPLYTDTDIHGPVVKALKRAGWDILRGIDARPEGTLDPVHFEHAAREGRVLVSNDEDMTALAERWFEEGRRFAGLIWWPRSHYRRMSPGDFVAAFAELAARDQPFAGYPIFYIKTQR
jgi:hypothetical protein